MKEKITFIIPTVGRDTLQRTINSLLKQTLPNWKAIVVFDGIEATQFDDPRISSFKIEKVGKANHAGRVRNFAIDQVDTEWIAFVDDDDTLSPNYLLNFEEELHFNPDAKCVIFRMLHQFGIMPRENDVTFHMNYVGISFAVKKKLGVKFEPSGVEDFNYLNEVRGKKNKMIISPYVNYFVRSEPRPEFGKVKLKRIIVQG